LHLSGLLASKRFVAKYGIGNVGVVGAFEDGG
jgi:hypothetical protein